VEGVPVTTTIEVVQGRFRIQSVDVIADRKDLLILSVDCHSKYPGMFVYGNRRVLIHSDDQAEYPEERSMHLDPMGSETCITLPEKCAGWNIIAEGERYTVTIVAFPVPDGTRRREAWSDR
jgi:hypothetical protein